MTMMLDSAIKLKVLEAIAMAGPDAKLSAHEIATRLSISNQDAPDKIDRMLRLLASHSVVTCTQQDHQSKPIRMYGLTPVAKYFIPNEDGSSLGLGPSVLLVHDKVFVDSWFAFKDSVMEGGVPFNKVHGTHLYEYPSLDSRFNDVFNTAMDSYTVIAMTGILECYHGFKELKSVVDVAGGLGININMIVSKYPTIKGINFDQPHVIRNAPHYHDQKIIIGHTLSAECKEKLYTILAANLDIFAWQPSDMTGVPREVAEHRLNVNPNIHPVCQKKRGMAPERSKFLRDEFINFAQVLLFSGG
ncbi:caffeic acid 3-O-methyltransferase-like [Rutidosis leptorrhynchoides]|uniref:caffeic acid 3-O-methyltransferase-like n=1 Tax=Rutidosis leptorrhynchoides TaxID=125765 RepID=UPI003A9A0BC2